jgi:outer membrane protein with beta-barrel domain
MPTGVLLSHWAVTALLTFAAVLILGRMSLEDGVLCIHRMNLRILVLAASPLIASAQLLTFGVQGGVPAQTPLGRTDKIPFVVGPSVDVRIVKGLAFETGFLYQRLGGGYDNFAFFGPANAITLGSETSRGSALELPFFAKYRFLNEQRRWRPFLLAGPSVRRTSIKTSNVQNTTVSGSSGSVISAVDTKSTQWNVDPSVGVGIDARVGRAHIEPEVRYSYWTAGKTEMVRKNQINFLVGLRF